MTVDSRQIARKTCQAMVSRRVFRARDIREEDLKYGETSEEARRMHNFFQRAEKNGAIVPVDGEKKRNRYYKVADEEKLRHLADSARGPNSRTASLDSGNGDGSAPAPAGPPRMVYLEDRVADVEQRQQQQHEELTNAVTGITSRFDALEDQVRRLVELWS
jgi:hypothetical protein